MPRTNAEGPHETGDLYRSLFDEMLEGFALHEIVCDDAGDPVDYRFIEVNAAFEQLTGLTRADIIEHTVSEVLVPIDPAWIERYHSVAVSGVPAHFRLPSASLDRTFDAHAYSPSPGRLAVLFQDVTEAERIALVLERDERLYRAAVETSADGFWMIDPRGTILTVNNTLCAMIGYDRSELIGMNVRDIEASETSAETTARIAGIMRDGPALFESTLRSKDGTVVPVEVNTSYWPIEDGRVFAFFRDIAKRRRAEYILRARAELLDLEGDSGLDDILRKALDKAELLTGSTVGFFHLVDTDQEHLSLQTWSTNTLATTCTAEGNGRHHPVADAGVWTESVRTRQPAIHNDYAHMDGRKGMPVGHAPVIRELVVPVVRGGSVIALMGVGNKKSDYTSDDIVPVTALANMAADVALHTKAQEEFERFFDLVPDLVAIVSVEGRFRRVNDQWSKTLGYTTDEMVMHPFLEFVHPDDVEATRATFASILEGDGVTGFVNRYMAKCGEYRWLEWSASPLGGDGLVFAVARDITSYKIAEGALRESEDRYRSLFENLMSGYAYCRVLYKDGEPVDWVYLAVNQAFETLTGISEAIGKRGTELIPGLRQADPALFDMLTGVAAGAPPRRFEWHVAPLNRWFDLRAHCPEAGYFAYVFDDITERKHSETEAAEREERLRALLDNAPYGAHMYELMPDDRLVFIGYNARAVEMLRVDHEAFIGLTLEEAFPGNIGTDTPEAYRRVAREGGTWSMDQYSYGDDHGITGVFEVFAFSFGPNRVSVFFRDVTDLRRAELELQSSEKDLRQAVSRLADVVRTLKALSACNEALVRAGSEKELLQSICDIAVNRGGYLMTWVGYAQNDEKKSVTPVAWAGAAEGYLEQISITWGDDGTAMGPGGTAIKTGAPVVIDSVEDDPRLTPWKTEALAHGFRSLATFPLTGSHGNTFGAIMFYSGEISHFEDEELVLLAELASDLSYGIEALRTRESTIEVSDRLALSNERLQALLRQITVALGRVVEARDPYTSGHEERVAVLARQIAVEMGLAPEDAEAVEITGLVHDIGKLSVPAEILTKPSALSSIELRLIRDHSRSGYEILKDIDFVWPVADIVLQHHERLDGSGYPNGIAGDDIMLLARVLAVADVVEAMASHRPYRPAAGLEAAVAEVSDHPELYDPHAAAACVRLYEAGAIDM
jgi:PAS domain S-box-containing protein/putative nucleotidyltransferase with HDIG domain